MNKFIFLFFLCFSTLALYSAKKEILFNQLIGKEQSLQKWIIEEDKEGIKLICFEDEGITEMECSLNYEVKKYSFKSKKSPMEYLLELKGRTIYSAALVNGKKIQTSHPARSLWIQQFSFGLKTFLMSKENTMDFCLINPQDFNMQKMTVKKKGVETISIEGKNFNAQKAIIKLSGFKGAFWEAELWFEKDTGDFLKYKANSGPNTPLTTIWLSTKAKK